MKLKREFPYYPFTNLVILSLIANQKHDVIIFHTGLPLLPLYIKIKYIKIRYGNNLVFYVRKARCISIGFFIYNETKYDSIKYAPQNSPPFLVIRRGANFPFNTPIGGFCYP